MEDLKNELILVLLATMSYDDMTPEQLSLVSKWETEKWKPEVDNLKREMSVEKVKEVIHEWWLDYEITDETENNLLIYAESTQSMPVKCGQNMKYYELCYFRSRKDSGSMYIKTDLDIDMCDDDDEFLQLLVDRREMDAAEADYITEIIGITEEEYVVFT